MIAHATLLTLQKTENVKTPNRNRDEQKRFWSNGFTTWTPEQFKENLRIDKETFLFILSQIAEDIRKEPTVIVPNPIEEHRQLALTVYRMAHGCSFKVLQHIFGVSVSLATETLL